MKHRRQMATFLVPLFCALSCRNSDDSADGSGKSLPPVYSLAPASSTNWDVNAGPVMLLQRGDNSDSVAIVLPEATDSTIEGLQNTTPATKGFVFELFGRSGKIGTSAAAPLPVTTDSNRDCNAWPVAKLGTSHHGWSIGFVRGMVRAISLDSIELMPSADSATLAALLTQNAATLPVASDPVFRRLPFRVRSAYRFRLDSVDVVMGDVVRALNEEANPRIEHLFLIGERSATASGNYAVRYYSRMAGPEETAQASEVLAVVQIGASGKPAVVLNIESENGARLGLIERTSAGPWRATWSSAYVDC